ncbi:hypothetical protein ACWJJH_00400 [Endozoicomonadaceae bacterium StTr2]
MKTFFFDLDETLLVHHLVVNRPGKLTAVQNQNLDGDDGCHICHMLNQRDGLIGLYPELHRRVFQYLSLTRDENRTFLLSDSAYDPDAICEALQGMFGGGDFFFTVPYIGRETYSLSISKGTRIMHTLRCEALAEFAGWSPEAPPGIWPGKRLVRHVRSGFLTLATEPVPPLDGNQVKPPDNCWLIDNMEHCRCSAAFYGIQVIDPTKEDYPVQLEAAVFH